MRKETKEQLEIKNAVLIQKIEARDKEDFSIRETLSELLDGYESSKPFGYSNEKKVLVRDWLGIAFLIGELKADADYAICIQNNNRLRNEIEELQHKIKVLEIPQK